HQRAVGHACGSENHLLAGSKIFGSVDLAFVFNSHARDALFEFWLVDYQTAEHVAIETSDSSRCDHTFGRSARTHDGMDASPTLGCRQYSDGPWSAGGAEIRPFERIDGNVNLWHVRSIRKFCPDFFADIQHGRFITLAFADHNRSAHRDCVHGFTHGFGRHLIGKVALAFPHGARRCNRCGLNHPQKSRCQIALNIFAKRASLRFRLGIRRSHEYLHLWARPMTINQPAAMRKLLPLLLLLVAPGGVFGLLPECLFRVHDFLTTSLRMKITHRSALEQAVALGLRPQL